MEKAKLTMTDKKTGYKLKWFGGHGVHIYEGKTEIGYFTTGDFSQEDASEKDIKESMKEQIKRGDYENCM